MKRIMSIIIAGLVSSAILAAPQCVFAKKGGVGNGGGSSDGIFYHSHSDRSYSGKDQFKGKGKALGRNKTKSKKGGSKAKSKKGDSQAKSKKGDSQATTY